MYCTLNLTGLQTLLIKTDAQDQHLSRHAEDLNQGYATWVGRKPYMRGSNAFC